MPKGMRNRPARTPSSAPRGRNIPLGIGFHQLSASSVRIGGPEDVGADGIDAGDGSRQEAGHRRTSDRPTRFPRKIRFLPAPGRTASIATLPRGSLRQNIRPSDPARRKPSSFARARVPRQRRHNRQIETTSSCYQWISRGWLPSTVTEPVSGCPPGRHA